MNNALSALCQRKLGFDPARLSESELRSRLPDIINAVASEYVYTHRQLAEVQKAARLHVQAYASFVPNDGFVRDEIVSPDLTAVDHSDPDPNAVLEAVLPV